VQGLLNHCRLSHGREFGSHDECIRGCAVLVPREEEAWVAEEGTELPEINLPSLRTLFERAVGGAGNLGLPVPTPPAVAAGEDAQSRTKANHALTPQDASTHLSRTLGHHIDTPALAPFLGRIVQRRAIALHEEDYDVDIAGTPKNAAKEPWRMPLPHRSVARPTLDLVDIDVPSIPPDLVEAPSEAPAIGLDRDLRTPMEVGGSRFHIAARIVVADRSLWLPLGLFFDLFFSLGDRLISSLDRRDPERQDHTHRWMISIDSPSYVRPLFGHRPAGYIKHIYRASTCRLF
jgi:hypothetical protein